MPCVTIGGTEVVLWDLAPGPVEDIDARETVSGKLRSTSGWIKMEWNCVTRYLTLAEANALVTLARNGGLPVSFGGVDVGGPYNCRASFGRWQGQQLAKGYCYRVPFTMRMVDTI